MRKNLTESELDGMLYIYYLNKLVEFNLIEGDVPTLTLKGFDLAHDLYEEGRKLDIDIIIKYTEVCIENIPNEFKEAVLDLIIHLQKVGFEQMKSEIENATKGNTN